MNGTGTTGLSAHGQYAVHLIAALIPLSTKKISSSSLVVTMLCGYCSMTIFGRSMAEPTPISIVSLMEVTPVYLQWFVSYRRRQVRAPKTWLEWNKYQFPSSPVKKVALIVLAQAPSRQCITRIVFVRDVPFNSNSCFSSGPGAIWYQARHSMAISIFSSSDIFCRALSLHPQLDSTTTMSPEIGGSQGRQQCIDEDPGLALGIALQSFGQGRGTTLRCFRRRQR